MRWRDADGVRWRLRQRRLAWRRRVKPEVAMGLFPSGLGQDPISLIIALPGLAVSAVMVPLWLAELLLRLLLAPVVVPLRLASVVPYRLELYRKGQLRATYEPKGRAELVRLRRRLARRHSQV
jgi:molybdopterin biosynthesis enzyme